MVVLCIVGPPCSGKHTIAAHFVRCYGFRHLCLGKDLQNSDVDEHLTTRRSNDKDDEDEDDTARQILSCTSARWQEDFVVTSIMNLSQMEIFRRRPFCFIIAVDAHWTSRCWRYTAKQTHASVRHRFHEPLANMDNGLSKQVEDFGPTVDTETILEEFGQFDFRACFGRRSPLPSHFLARRPEAEIVNCVDYADLLEDEVCRCPCFKRRAVSGGDIAMCMSRTDVTIMNDGSFLDLFAKIAELPNLAKQLVRPNWDLYFIRLAFLASSRSNCMKRRVGAVVVRDNRVVATGYNGTAMHTLNCNDGGCMRCNDPNVTQGQALEACECLHAEVNALIEAGRERCLGSSLFITTMPCLSCAKLVVQAGIRRVVFNSVYDEGCGAEGLLKKAGVVTDKFSAIWPGLSLDVIRPFVPSLD